MKKIIKKLVPEKTLILVKNYLKLLKSYTIENPYSNELKHKKKIIIFCTPLHGNLGDQAIAYAQVQFFEKHYPEYYIMELPMNDIYFKLRFIKKIVTKEDLLFIHGGGNIGDLYLNEEIARRKVIKCFKEQSIIQLPQSYTFTERKGAEKEKEATRKIYGKKQKNLTIVARETRSLNLMKDVFKDNSIIYTPDIVLSLNEKQMVNREGILICLRNDGEQVISKQNKEILISYLKNKYKKVKVTDTTVEYKIDANKRYKELTKKWNEYRNAKVVITDRLHGMIFSVITGTPCIVFDNFNQKVQKTYIDWLQECNNIKFIDVVSKFDLNKIDELIIDMNNENSKMFNPGDKYEPLIDKINENIDRARKEL